ncbi:MAG: aldose 1-epimerase family protein [Bacteroidetes bacterium]|nr:aldose 1-epimerase family protein [Bacteroidota bacterium]
MYSIENEQLSISVSTKGAELQSIFHKKFKLEYMWDGDPAFWGKKSPVLFPIVGTLKGDTYFIDKKAYHLTRHGFAREMEFEVKGHTADSITFFIKSNFSTLKQFPFEFEFSIRYKLSGNNLTVTYIVKNTSDSYCYFSVGGHPAFKAPLVEGTSYDDYYLEFNEDETLSRWPISKEGLIEKTPEPFLTSSPVLPLRKELFYKDALVFKYPTSSIVSLKSDKTEHGLDFDFDGFPFLGIWAAKNADFVCIEPWCGIADSVDTDQQFTHKEGINKLKSKEVFERSWSVTFF